MRKFFISRKMMTALLALSFLFLIEILQSEPSEQTGVNIPSPRTRDLYDVVKVVDGDTIDVTVATSTVRVRLLGINAPESVDPRRKVECFGKEASVYLKDLLDDQEVILTADLSQDDKDKYGRLLRYVSLKDGTDINKQLVAEGFAYEYTYDVSYQFQAVYKEAQTRAKEGEKGLWSKNTCAGRK